MCELAVPSPLQVKSVSFLSAASQLCHMDTGLAEKLWLELYPRLWTILLVIHLKHTASPALLLSCSFSCSPAPSPAPSPALLLSCSLLHHHYLQDKQREGLAAELVPFICSGSHVIQKDCQPSALNTFVEGVSRCQPGVAVPPSLLKYLGKSHNLWHRTALLLEQQAFDPTPRDLVRTKKEPSGSGTGAEYDFEPVAGPSSSTSPSSSEAMDGLAELYGLLQEEDMWAGLWTKKAKYPETNIAICYEQQGFYEQAQGAYELAMSKYRADVATKPAPGSVMQEVRVWEEHWIRCSKELNQWETLLEYGSSSSINSPSLMAEAAWRVAGQWGVMKEALQQVGQAVSTDQGDIGDLAGGAGQPQGAGLEGEPLQGLPRHLQPR